MLRLLSSLAAICLILISLSYAAVGGSGLEFEDLIPRDEYDPNTIHTISGPVQEVQLIPKLTGMGSSVVVRFGSEEDAIYALLGPDWFLRNQDFYIEVEDRLKVTGSSITFQEKRVIIASEVEHQGKTLYLRNEKTGTPEWSEWRKGEQIFYKNYDW